MEVGAAFGRVLRRVRIESGLTQEQLGLEADLRRTYVSTLELGQQQPTITTIFKLARALKIPAAQLVSMTEREVEIAD